MCIEGFYGKGPGIFVCVHHIETHLLLKYIIYHAYRF